MVDKDSNFLGEFVKTAALLKTNIHSLSRGNHDPMIVERVCRFLNTCLTIFCNERGTNRVALEGILMSLYAWNSAPVVGTDISRSLLVTGREFSFPIDFSHEQHQILTSTPRKVASFAAEQATLLECGQKLAKELVQVQRDWHREYINQRRPDPRQYAIGDRVFVRRAVKSVKKHGLVGKLMDSYTGPWIHRERNESSGESSGFFRSPYSHCYSHSLKFAKIRVFLDSLTLMRERSAGGNKKRAYSHHYSQNTKIFNK